MDKRRVLYLTQSLAGLLAAVFAVTVGTHSIRLRVVYLLAVALGGAIAAAIGLTLCFACNAASFGAVLVSLAAIGRPAWLGSTPVTTVLTVLLPTPLNPGAGDRVISGVGSIKGASLPRRSWLGIAGAVLLAASGAIHLDLYLTGYRSIPAIGWLFLLQIIAAYVLAAAIPVTRHWLAAAAGAGFAASTLGGYLLSLKVGLFGFTEVRTTAGIVAGVIDAAAFAVLAVAVVQALDLGARAIRAAAAASALALVLLGVFVATPRTQPAATGAQVLKSRMIGGVNLLTDSRGLTLYAFAPDGPGKSACYGSCTAYWPPVPGNAAAGPGVIGTIGTISRAGGTTQATYDGHPLYTYIGDSAPGQDGGNGINLNGGLWHDVPVSRG